MKGIKFGTDGWRAVMADSFTFDNLALVSQALADYIVESGGAERGLVIGHDNRFLAEEFSRLVAEVMTANGITVWLPNTAIPTPVTAFAVLRQKAFGAVMLTASHNPPVYNGIKFIPEYGGPATSAVTDLIEEKLGRVRPENVARLPLPVAEQKGLVQAISPFDAYLKELEALVDLEAIKRAAAPVVVDPLYGAGIGYLETFLRRMGWRVTALHDWRDPLFGGQIPEPSARVLEEMASQVIREGACLGLALDGDADRFGVVDEKGDYLTANQVLALIYHHLLHYKKQRGPLARTVATTHLLDRIAAEYDCGVQETPVGFKYIGHSLREGALLGGEESGGLSVRGHLPEKDGILAGILVVEAVAVSGKTVSQLLQEIGELYGQVYNRRLDRRVEPGVKEELLAKVRHYQPAKVAGLPVVERLTVDGTKLKMADGSWVLVRPSGTEPLFRVYAEASSPSLMDSIQQEVISELGL